MAGRNSSSAGRVDAQFATRPVDSGRQRDALNLMIAALSPAELAIPDTVLALLAPAPPSFGNNVEIFKSRTRPIFDELGAVRTLAQMVVDALLQRDRAARLVQFARFDRNPL